MFAMSAIKFQQCLFVPVSLSDYVQINLRDKVMYTSFALPTAAYKDSRVLFDLPMACTMSLSKRPRAEELAKVTSLKVRTPYIS